MRRFSIPSQLRLESLGYKVWTADTAASGIRRSGGSARRGPFSTSACRTGGTVSRFSGRSGSNLPDTIVLVITAQGLLNQYMKAMSLDAQEFLHKPISAKLLDKIIRTAMENRSANPGTVPRVSREGRTA